MKKLRAILKKAFIFLLGGCEKFSDENFSKVLYWIEFMKVSNILQPISFNEHISRLKTLKETETLSTYTDKYAVREYVARVSGSEYLNEILGVYDSFDEIDFSSLPDRFALKCTHSSGFNVIVKDKNQVKLQDIKKKFDKWLKTNYYHVNRERNYRYIKPRILCDAYLESENGHLDEYKLFCFNGKVRLIQHNKETSKERYANLYDENWRLLDVEYGYPRHQGSELPNNKNEMVKVAEELSAIFCFVRVDLYNLSGKIYFSELTFHPSGGHIRFNPQDFDKVLGMYFTEEKSEPECA